MEDTIQYLSITAVTRYLKYRFDNDGYLQDIYLKGEISNFKPHTRGHFYFTLKDENSRISAIMFISNASKLPFTPEDGMKVLVRGKISVYEPTGNYQIYVSEMQEDGVGNLYIAFEQLKAKLQKEGLFDVEHKKALPKIPKKIGIVTAPTGAAIKDILSTLKRRFPLCETILFPSLVQGTEAHINIVKQIKKAQEYDIDLLIVGRGGGSIEDLWPFNEEDVARAIYNSKIPTISAVGHEIDYTISDFVADVRAATPTASAEIAVPNMIDILNHIDNLKIRANKVTLNKMETLKLMLHKLKDSYALKNPLQIYEIKEQLLDSYIEKANTIIINMIEKRKLLLANLKSNYILNNPLQLYEIKEQLLDSYIEKANTLVVNIIEKKEVNLNNLKNTYVLNYPNKLFDSMNNNLSKYIEKLKVLNPLNTLKRGYTIVKKDNKAISNINNLNVKDQINIIFDQGIINANIVNIKEN